MKKLTIIGLAGLFLLGSLTGIKDVLASEEPSGKQVEFKPTIKFAVESTETFDFYWWSIGTDFDLHINKTLMISPEISMQAYKFEFDNWLMLYPGITINTKFGSPDAAFFIGAGSLLFIPINPGGADSLLMFKAHLGALIDKFKLTLYLVTPFKYFFEPGVGIGLSVGYVL
jgi:uncharacterized protein YbaA (DUF1428 family)